ncbi:hypothetical protein EUGRSUZ_L00307 [Eucalyptus grandis]|uniref:Uncharacterized protein n=1 Tax=Eucalyptus grandis TaxID=71139 RepID=A0A058ZWV4_EUCGR|nr:hypothetical protein EUGRSUZ_L00307 [Eucalyptus grandis]
MASNASSEGSDIGVEEGCRRRAGVDAGEGDSTSEQRRVAAAWVRGWLSGARWRQAVAMWASVTCRLCAVTVVEGCLRTS